MNSLFLFQMMLSLDSLISITKLKECTETLNQQIFSSQLKVVVCFFIKKTLEEKIGYFFIILLGCKICDFGISKMTNFGNTLVGTPIYSAPEINEKKPYTSAVDVWSFGIVLMEMILSSLTSVFPHQFWFWNNFL